LCTAEQCEISRSQGSESCGDIASVDSMK